MMKKLKAVFLTILLVSGLIGIACANQYYSPSQRGISVINLPGKTILLLPSDRLFQLNSPNLTEDGVDILEKTADILKNFPNEDIYITANTDPIGNNIYFLNDPLSKRQVLSVAGYLWANGLSSNKNRVVVYKGLGASDPLVSNLTLAGMTMNRRIQITVTKAKNRFKEQPILPVLVKRYYK